jgi:hypothetical protein
VATVLRRVVDVAIPLALSALELVHPAGSGDQAVLAAGGWWIPLHIALIVGYGLLVASLWLLVRRVGGAFALVAGASLGLFLASNFLFLAIDGVGIGLAAPSDPTAANELWSSPLVVTVANVTGAAWSLALLAVAAALQPVARTRIGIGGMTIIWLAFAASSLVPGAALASRAAAVATGAWAVYTTGAGALPFALLVFAAVLRQHVGPEAALGMLCIALAHVLQSEASGAA